MSARKCHLCGIDPAAGYASVWTKAEGERWYCHGDDDEYPTCYERQTSPFADPLRPTIPEIQAIFGGFKEDE